MRSDKVLSDLDFYISRRNYIVNGISPKRCSKSHIALLLSSTHLRRFYLLGYIPLTPIVIIRIYLSL